MASKAELAEAIRLRRRRETARQVLANAGYQVTKDGIQHMRERVRGLEARRRQAIEADGE